MADKALLIGINNYPQAPLAGCVNDIHDVANFLVQKYNFKHSQVRLLVDGRATTKNILSRLDWLVSNLHAGDRVLFDYSGHGAQFAGRGSDNEVDKLNEVVCPVDFDWSEEKMISDKQFHEIFSRIPAGVKFNWISDSCHSGSLTRDLPPPGAPKNCPRMYPVPLDMHWRLMVADEKKILNHKMSKNLDKGSYGIAGALNVGFISGCKSDQTSADTVINGRPCGALTHYFLKALDGMLDQPLKVITSAVAKSLQIDRYSQIPQAEGVRISNPFLK